MRLEGDFRVLVIEPCGIQKTFDPRQGPPKYAWSELQRGRDDLESLRTGRPTQRAWNAYAGPQHKKVVEACGFLELVPGMKLDQRILSAGFGLLEKDEQIPDYDSTFCGRDDDEILERARALRIPEMASAAVKQADVALFLGANDYWTSLDVVNWVTPKDLCARIVRIDNHAKGCWHTVPLGGVRDQQPPAGGGWAARRGFILAAFARGILHRHRTNLPWRPAGASLGSWFGGLVGEGVAAG